MWRLALVGTNHNVQLETFGLSDVCPGLPNDSIGKNGTVLPAMWEGRELTVKQR